MERRGTGADTLPPPPEFEEAIERVRERIAKTVGKLTVPREMRIWHPVVDKLLKEDEQRRDDSVPVPMCRRGTLRDSILLSREGDCAS